MGSRLHLVPFVALLMTAALWDIFRRRIPNPVSAGVAAIGLALQAKTGGPGAAAVAAAAGVAVVAVLWLPWRAGKLGGGDVKLAGAAATGIGFSALPEYLIMSAIAGGLVASVCYLLSSTAVKREITSNLRAMASGAARPQIPLAGTGGRVSVPYGVSFVAGAIVALVLDGGRL